MDFIEWKKQTRRYCEDLYGVDFVFNVDDKTLQEFYEDGMSPREYYEQEISYWGD